VIVVRGLRIFFVVLEVRGFFFFFLRPCSQDGGESSYRRDRGHLYGGPEISDWGFFFSLGCFFRSCARERAQATERERVRVERVTGYGRDPPPLTYPPTPLLFFPTG
jgi:hypothetical protein